MNRTDTDSTDLYIGTQPNPADRLRLRVSLADEARMPDAPSRRSFVVTDVNTGVVYRLRRASCGAPHCMCALALVDVVHTPARP